FDTRGLTFTRVMLDGTQVLDSGLSDYLHLTPGTHTLTDFLGSSVTFTAAADGTVDYDHALDPVLSGRGTTTLVVNGVTVTIDAPALSVRDSLLLENAVLVRSATAVSFTVLPGNLFLRDGAGGGDFRFTLNANGTVSYAPSLEGLLSGAGTSTLVVHGVSFTV